MIPIPHTWVLILATVLFCIGAIGVLLRRNGIAIFLSLEIMLNSANLAFAAFALELAHEGHGAAAAAGQLFVFFIIAVAAAEAAVGLALFIAMFRLKETIDVDRFNILRW
ncbi:MAG TPA: NADH-quinone oxidoreductase subunit NuoK [Acidobacteria bacterium]|nr:NADH-quinone oxidoreductase subunit NuoK [Acidobacteriota bacterium]